MEIDRNKPSPAELGQMGIDKSMCGYCGFYHWFSWFSKWVIEEGKCTVNIKPKTLKATSPCCSCVSLRGDT